MVNDQDNTNIEIGTITQKEKTNGQDTSIIMIGGNDTHVRDGEHGTKTHKEMVNNLDTTTVNGGNDDKKEKNRNKNKLEERFNKP